MSLKYFKKKDNDIFNLKESLSLTTRPNHNNRKNCSENSDFYHKNLYKYTQAKERSQTPLTTEGNFSIQRTLKIANKNLNKSCDDITHETSYIHYIETKSNILSVFTILI